MAWTAPRTWVTDELVDASTLNTHLRDNLISVLPTGTIVMLVQPYTDVETAVESRWLQCNGAAVSRTTYATLFNLLNALSPALPFGNGNGSTTFNLPDFRGRLPVAEGTHSSVDDIGDSDGVTLASRRPQHYHNSQYGTTSVGGSVPVAAQFDNSVTNTYPTTPGSTDNILNAPAHLVFGSFFIKYT